MSTNPSPAGDLNDLEHRLAEWRPATAGLDADRMLFAAGRDSVRPGWGRNVLPIISVCLALLAALFGVGFAHERAAKLDLITQLRDTKPSSVPEPYSEPDSSGTPWAEAPAASSYLAAHAALAQNPESWLAQAKIEPAAGTPRPSPSRPILKANSSSEMLEH
jgi:hypothetical protein